MKIDLRQVQGEARVLVRHIARDRATLGVGAALAVLVLALIGIYVIASLAQDRSDIAAGVAYAFDLSRERSYSEVVGYGITFLATTMFFLAFLEHGAPVLLLLSAMTGFIWFDDSFQVHERFGNLLNAVAQSPATADLHLDADGEILIWLLVAVFFFLVLRWCLTRLRPGDLGVVATVFAAFAVLVVFAMGVDFAHIFVPASWDWTVATIEDGGEMLSFVLIATIAVGVSRQAGAHYKDCGSMDGEAAEPTVRP